MKISALRILNYKGFSDTEFIELNHSWNVLVGQNNAGKTAFMEGFRFSRNVSKPHKDIRFAKDHSYSSVSHFIARLQFSREWLKGAWLKQGGEFYIPTSVTTEVGRRYEIDPLPFWEGDDFDVELDFGAGSIASSSWPSHRLFEGGKGSRIFTAQQATDDHQVGVQASAFGGDNDSLPQTVSNNISDKVYVFEAKRFAVGECAHEDTAVLAPSATNLPAVLIKLASNPDLFDEYNCNVSTIFPSIKKITVTTFGNNFQIRVWPVDPSTRRDDLAVPLNECGAGVGQVLSILYVAMTSAPGVIAIDEPNSFLHPGAAKKLVQILKRYPHHQYIISTHSPEVMAEAQPATLHLIRYDGIESTVESFDESEVETKRMMLEEVGASISDVFGADRVIWVEGPTERECFDLIIAREFDGPIVGLSLVSLRNTGDLDGKQADAALDIYDALTKGGSILPVSSWFSFDREGKSDQKIDDIYRRCGGRAKFLPRAMTENYLLSPAAISKVLHALGEEMQAVDAIEGLLKKHASNRMLNKVVQSFGSKEFYINVDGANLLKDVFNEASDARHSYRKVRDGVELLKAVLDDERETVDELVKFVGDLIHR